MRFWLLKGPPDDARYASTWLEEGQVTPWPLRKAAPDWSAGDGVFLWEGGGKARLVGLAEIASTERVSSQVSVVVRTVAPPLRVPLASMDLRADILLGDAAFLQAGPRQVIALEPDQARRLGRLVARRQRTGADVLERWLGRSTVAHKAILAEEVPLDGSKPIVLLAVDDPALRNSLVSWAEDFWGDEVALLEREDGHEAWATMLEYRPALVVASEMLTSLSGHEIAAKLRKQKALLGTRLALLANSESADDALLESGVDVVLRKPLRRIEVERRLGGLLER